RDPGTSGGVAARFEISTIRGRPPVHLAQNSEKPAAKNTSPHSYSRLVSLRGAIEAGKKTGVATEEVRVGMGMVGSWPIMA
ncbi:MAG: hypothetical protein J0I90_04570, partial [Nitrosospira sp.]|nr:hypothetical protein [Nitrosospira sp.]